MVSSRDKKQPLAQRRARVGIGAMIEQKAGELGVLLPAAQKSLRDNATEQGRVSAEAVGVDLGFGVYVGAMIDQPARDFDLVEVDADVQQRRSRERCAVQAERVVGAASQFRRIDLFVGEGPRDQVRITAQMRFQQIDSAAVQRHHRRVGKNDATLGYQFKTAMLCFRIAAIGLQKQRDGGEVVAILIGEFGAEFEQKREPCPDSAFRTAPSRSLEWDALPWRADGGRFRSGLAGTRGRRRAEIFRAHLAEHRDDRVLPDVRRVGHGRTPVAVGYAARGFVQQLRIFQHQLADRSTSPRQIASVMRQAVTSRGQLGRP